VARLVRSRILDLSQEEFVIAAMAAGASRRRVLWRHLLPNLRETLQAASILLLARAIHAEAALSFLGFGVRPPQASWGNLLADARHHVGLAPWLALGPGLCLFVTLWSMHRLGARRGET
jgi:peptide/nickel transport system permease protein